MEEDALLGRRQRVEVVDLAPGQGELVQRRLGEAGEGEVGGRGAVAVEGGKAGKVGGDGLTEAGKGRFLPARGGGGEAQLGAGFRLAGIHDQLGAEGQVRIGRKVHGGEGEQGAGATRIHPSEMVENERRGRAQGVGDGTAGGLLGGEQSAAQVVLQRHGSRGEGGEPAHGAAEIGARHQVPPMPLDAHRELGQAAQASRGPHHGGQQQVVEPGMVGVRHLSQRLHLRGIEGEAGQAAVAEGVRALRMVAGQGDGGYRDGCRRPVQGADGEGRAGAGRGEGAALFQVEIGASDLVQQDPPGDRIHHQMVGGEKQPLRAVVELRQKGTEQRARGEVERAFEGGE